MNIKKIGSFYTPSSIALWMSERALKSTLKARAIRVLEPSCGDGVFIDAIASFKHHTQIEIDAIEYNLEAFQNAEKNHKSYANIINADFLFWRNKRKYDLVLGNPPYIVKKLFKKTQAEQCKKIHIDSGMREREVANIWTSFVLKSTECLDENGVLGLVLPTELLQVNYAEEIRHFLLDQFKRLEIISFRNLAFENIEQDTVILMAYKNPSAPSGLYFAEVSSTHELISKELKLEKHHGNCEAKWSSYILSEEEMNFIHEMSLKCKTVSDVCKSVAGIVTAANGYFIVTQGDVEKYELQKYVKKIIQKGLYVNGSAELTAKDYNNLKKESKPCFIIDLNDVLEKDFSLGLVEYLKLGEAKKIPERYKCKLRNRWFDVPSIWKSEGFFFKRGHHYPKLLVNKANVYVTDSAYRIRMKEGLDIESFASSFYNSLTLLCAELNGRYYGGGVLELTPNEFKRLPLPYRASQKDEYNHFISHFKNKESIDLFLKEHDKKVLSESYEISEKDTERLYMLYKKVKNRRLKGKYV